MSILKRPTLVLNKNWVTISTVSVERAVIMLSGEWTEGDKKFPKATVLDVETGTRYSWDEWIELPAEEGEPVLHGGRGQKIKVPEIIIVTRYGKIPKNQLNFNRRNIIRRDNGTCFIPGTLITTKNLELKPIEDIQIGDEIIDMYGQSVIVEHVNVRHISEEIKSIRCRGVGNPLKCTKNHKIITSSWDGDTSPDSFKFAESITKKDYLSQIVVSNFANEEYVDLVEYSANLKYLKYSSTEIKHYCGNSVKRIIKLDENLGRLLGYFLSEGCKEDGVISFSFNINEVDYIKDVQKLIFDIFGLRSRLEINKEKNLTKVFLSNTVVANYISKLFYKNGDKSLNNQAWINKKTGLGIISGVCRGDGAFNQKFYRCILMMSREHLINELYLLCNRLDLFPTLSKTAWRKDGRIYKSIIFQANEFNKLIKICDLKYDKYINSKKVSDRNILENRIVSKVWKIEEEKYVGPVYDLQVSGSHTYVANFICVHNCQYCNEKGDSIDHVLPRSRGGGNTWENCVWCCFRCNQKKANCTPEEADMKLIREPCRPGLEVLGNTGIRIKSWEIFFGRKTEEIVIEKEG